jgi:site-specific DNA-cytosine methylase
MSIGARRAAFEAGCTIGAHLAIELDAGASAVYGLNFGVEHVVTGAVMRDRLASHVPVPAPLQTDAHRGDDPR